MVRIYKLFDPRNPEEVRYIGKTNRENLNIRLSEHICHARSKNYHVSNWINKISSLNIKPSIALLHVCEDEDWEFWEKFYIKKYKTHNLTNIESGGKSVTLRKYTKVGTNKNIKEVDQLTLDFKHIKSFKSVAEAARKLNLNKGVLAATCRGKQSKAYGYRWKYSKDLEVKLKEDPKKKAIIQLDLENNFIREYSSIQEASNVTGANRSGISACINGLYKQTKNSKWKLKN